MIIRPFTSRGGGAIPKLGDKIPKLPPSAIETSVPPVTMCCIYVKICPSWAAAFVSHEYQFLLPGRYEMEPECIFLRLQLKSSRSQGV